MNLLNIRIKNMIEYVSLVDRQDNETGIMEKMAAHQQGLLHRALSVFIFNDQNEFLLLGNISLRQI